MQLICRVFLVQILKNKDFERNIHCTCIPTSVHPPPLTDNPRCYWRFATQRGRTLSRFTPVNLIETQRSHSICAISLKRLLNELKRVKRDPCSDAVKASYMIYILDSYDAKTLQFNEISDFPFWKYNSLRNT